MSFQKKPKPVSKEEVLKKAQKYCAYQERCHSEVRSKLYEWRLRTNEVEEIIVSLIEQDFLNEERFAKLFAGGKFRMKKWGKNKIIREMKSREVSEYCIKKGLEEIDEVEYLKTLKDLMKKKDAPLKGLDSFEKNGKIAAYLIGKGYEPELVWQVLKPE